MGLINTRVIGLGNAHTARTGAGVVVAIEQDFVAEYDDDLPWIKVIWDSGDTSWVNAGGVKPEQ